MGLRVARSRGHPAAAMSDTLPTCAHIRCGDDLRDLLAAAGLLGPYVRWCDPVADGPCPEALEGEDWRLLRARWLSDRYDLIFAETLARLEADDGALFAAIRRDDALALWFEDDLFDQAILVRLLAWLADRESPPVSLIQFEGRLAEQSPESLRALFDARQPVDDLLMDQGRRCWAAWRSDQPTDLIALAAETIPGLPFFPSALRRHFEEFPCAEDGLSRTERMALIAAADGAGDDDGLFSYVRRTETAPWLGDTMFFAVLRDLSTCRQPLIRRTADGTWAPTPAGLTLLMGRPELSQLNVIDRWRGGVHISLRNDWRWSRRDGVLKRY